MGFIAHQLDMKKPYLGKSRVASKSVSRKNFALTELCQRKSGVGKKSRRGYHTMDTLLQHKDGRWLNRDPSKKEGVNLYGFIDNDGVGALIF